jgi:hypothetical protein
VQRLLPELAPRCFTTTATTSDKTRSRWSLLARPALPPRYSTMSNSLLLTIYGLPNNNISPKCNSIDRTGSVSSIMRTNSCSSREFLQPVPFITISQFVCNDQKLFLRHRNHFPAFLPPFLHSGSCTLHSGNYFSPNAKQRRLRAQ